MQLNWSVHVFICSATGLYMCLCAAELVCTIVVVKLLDLDPQGWWFDPWCGHDKICTAVGSLSKALNPTLLQGVRSVLVRSVLFCISFFLFMSYLSCAMFHVYFFFYFFLCPLISCTHIHVDRPVTVFNLSLNCTH